MIAEWLTWGQAHSAILSVLGALIVATGTVTAALYTAGRYLEIYQTHVSLDFFRRYSEIANRMPDRMRLSKISDPLIAHSPAVSPEEWPAIARSMLEYANLCSEEFALNQKNRIPPDIWNICLEGIRENFETKIWRDAWRLVRVEYKSHAEFYSWMDEVIKKSEARGDA